MSGRTTADPSAPPPDCLAEMYGDLCDEMYRRWSEGFEGLGAWDARLEAAVFASLDCIEFAPGARGVILAGVESGDPRIAEQKTVLRNRLSALLACEYDGDLEDLPELHFEFLLGAISRTAADALSAGEPLRRVRQRVRTAIASLEPAVA